jgi:hypothetical protein
MVATFEHPKLGTSFHNLRVLFIVRWPMLKRAMGCRLHEKCSAGCERQENRCPESPTRESPALDKQSKLNYDSNGFLYMY